MSKFKSLGFILLINIKILPSRYHRHHCVTDRCRILSNVTHGSSTLHIVTSTLPTVTVTDRYLTVTDRYLPLLTVTKAFFIVFLSFLAIIQRLFLRKSTTPKKIFDIKVKENFFSQNIFSHTKLR